MSLTRTVFGSSLRPCTRTSIPANRAAKVSPLRALSQVAPASPYAQAAKAGFGRRIAAVGLGAGLGFVGLQSLGLSRQEIRCDSLAAPAPVASGKADALPTEPKSILSPYELSLGAICGICAGVFIKKGAKLIAFFLGGVYVLMQYMQSRSFININWSKLSSSYENTFGSLPSTGSSLTETKRKLPTVTGVVQWFVDFLTANFQQRASFLAGLGLGLRIG
ncbi:hypothetical protein NliqN6_0841 [Naganishia liquefaciens]|uniref:FUN14 domain-containing protein n=1 Tax=Naganishia liquefaciens TaxID=104408 RepID=A0A8H3TQG2_9TREE|nr:hypothetical protein NliqN6_0841 [Naganishia liquefaciens]